MKETSDFNNQNLSSLMIFFLLLCTVSLMAQTTAYKKWHPLELHFQGPTAREMDNEPNPFLDYRLQVLFTSPGGAQYDVPGFYQGDGSGGGDGNVWSVRFTPDKVGEWSFKTFFRAGKNIAVDLAPSAGHPIAFDGQQGSFHVESPESDSPDLLTRGRLEYADSYYLKFADGPYWIKGGCDSPEDFLAYQGFDNTRSGSNFPAKA